MVKSLFSLVVIQAVFFLSCFYPVPTQASVTQDAFPVYECLKDNIAFWKKVYAGYPTTKGLIHDNRDLSVIYEVIDLEPQDEAGAAKINKIRIEQAKGKYRDLLLSLAAGREAKTAEEKRVLFLFGGKPSAAQLSQAADSIRFQLCLKDHFLEGLIRSEAYLAEIKKIFRNYNLPEDLAYLPHVESSFNYKAYSKFGAAGIWQFTRSTGTRYMTIDYTLDERRDPIRATHAAARFLAENYEKLGSWPMALTAYNHGPNGMMRARNALGSYEKIFNGYDGKLFGFASRNFYSEFIAAREVAKNYRKYFGNVTLAEPVSFVEVTIPGYAPIKDLARRFRVDLVTLKELNPALRPPVFEGRKHVPKGYRLRVPGKNGQGVKLASVMPNEAFAEKQKRSRFYQVKKGDSAGAIAVRYGLKLDDLIAANGLDSQATVYVGQNLRIPTMDEKVVLLAQIEKNGQETVVAQADASVKRPREIVLLKAEKMKKKIASSTKTETSMSSAKATTSSQEKLADERMANLQNMPEEGKQLAQSQSTQGITVTEENVEEEAQAQFEQAEAVDNLPKASATDYNFNPEVVTGDLLVKDARIEKGRPVGYIHVEVDETLGHYADWLKLPTSRIRNLNNLHSGDPIKIGQRLKVEFTKVSREDFEETRYEYHKEIEEDFFGVYKIEGARLYRIKAGDHIWRLCQEEFDLPMWLVMKFNTAHDFNNLKLDEQLIIPIVGEIKPQ